MTKTSDLDLKFPLLGFTPDGQIWAFPDRDTLTTCGKFTLKDNLQLGLELIDSEGRRWIVRSIRRIGRDRPLLPWLFVAALSGPLWRIEQEVDAMSPIAFEEIRDRAVQATRLLDEHYYTDDDKAELRQLVATVGRAKDVATIIEVMNPDSFKSS